MNPYNALERISWRFNQKKAFTPSRIDFEAYNALLEFFNEYQKRETMENLLFAKLYLHVYTKFLIHYNATPSDPIPQKELHEIIGRSFNRLFEDLHTAITTIDLEQQIKSGAKNIEQHKYSMDDIKYNMNLQMAKAIEQFKS